MVTKLGRKSAEDQGPIIPGVETRKILAIVERVNWMNMVEVVAPSIPTGFRKPSGFSVKKSASTSCSGR